MARNECIRVPVHSTSLIRWKICMRRHKYPAEVDRLIYCLFPRNSMRNFCIFLSLFLDRKENNYNGDGDGDSKMANWNRGQSEKIAFSDSTEFACLLLRFTHKMQRTPDDRQTPKDSETETKNVRRFAMLFIRWQYISITSEISCDIINL